MKLYGEPVDLELVSVDIEEVKSGLFSERSYKNVK